MKKTIILLFIFLLINTICIGAPIGLNCKGTREDGVNFNMNIVYENDIAEIETTWIKNTGEKTGTFNYTNICVFR